MLKEMTLPPIARQWIDRIGGPRRAGVLGAGIAAVVLILGLARWATAPSWVPVYTDLPLESAGAVTERLDEERIAYRLAGSGTELRVKSGDLARARVALASEGIPQSGRPGLELFDQPAWGMTDFTQRINYRRALEGELERTIAKMRGVDGVKVHIAMEEATGLRRSGRPSEASVVLSLRRGSAPTAEIVQGISHLVASSVDGVEADRVMVLDDSGRLLSSPHDQNSPAALASRELQMRREVEQYLASKAEQLVAQIVGPGNVRVQVSTEINLDRLERTVEMVDPERQTLSSEQRSEIIPGDEGGAGSTSVTATYLNARSLETFSGAVGNVKRVSAAVLVNDRFVAGDEGGRFEPRTPAELARIETLVASAVGIAPERGDVISVVSFPFDAQLPSEEGPDLWMLVQQFHRPGIAILALLLTFVIALRVTRTLREPQQEVAMGALSGGDPEFLDVTVDDDDEEELSMLEAELDLVLPARGPTPRERVVSQIDSDPETALKLVRAWMREE